MALYGEDFAKILSNLLDKHGITCYKLAQYSHLDQGFLSRLRSGELKNPSPETVVKISVSLAHWSADITIWDIENLFNACGRSLNKL